MFSWNCLVSHKSDPCNLDPWPSEHKNIRDRVLTKTNQQVENKSSVINSFQEPNYGVFFTKVALVNLPFDLVNTKSKGAMSAPIPISMWKVKPLW